MFVHLKNSLSGNYFIILNKLYGGDRMMRDSKKYAHGISREWVHVSFKAKYCHNIFTYAYVREECKKIFFEVAKNYDIGIKSMGFDKNHVHMVNDLGKYSKPELRKIFKGTSGKRLLKKFPLIKKKYFWGSGLWGRQYYCYSIGSDMRVLNKYVSK